MPQDRDETVLEHEVTAPVMIAAICDRLADLSTSQAMRAHYEVAVDQLIACGGGQVAALAKLQHLRKRLFCQQTSLDPASRKDLALLDAAIGELANA